ncbi:MULTISPECIES: hypothetical protein [unclassified Bradyrhizobium]
MLSSDYQEFANRVLAGHRDNTVIYNVRTWITCRKRTVVATLPRDRAMRKRNFLPNLGHTAPQSPEFADRDFVVNAKIAQAIP